MVRAQVVGTRGVVNVTGPQLRRVFGLFDTWAYFTSVGTHVKKPAAPPAPTPSGGAPADGGTAAAAAANRARLAGEVAPARAGAWITVQRRAGSRWVTAADARLARGGRYSVAVGPGTYRVAYGRSTGPVVRVR